MGKTGLMIGGILMIASFAFADPKGEGIAKKSFDLKRSSDSFSVATMVLIDRNGNRKQRKLEMYGKEEKNGRNSFIVFLEPADVKGSKFLTIGNKTGDDDQRLYLPALKKVRKIASSGKDGKFMGSDITYYDMEERSFEDFHYKYLKDEVFNGKDCYVVEMTSLKKDSPYSRSVAWIAKDDHYAYKRELYGSKNNALVKIIVAQEVKVMEGVIVVTKMVVDNVKDGTKTLLINEGDKINTGLKSSVFSVENLQK